MQKDDLKIIGFAAVVCVVCSFLLTAAARGLKQRQDTMVELDRQVNVLKAFGVPVRDAEGRKISNEQVTTYFAENIVEVLLDKETGAVLEGQTSKDIPKNELKAKTTREKTRLPLYLWKEGGQVTKYAFPVSGMGLWSIIHGYLALGPDLSTVVGVTFYKHGETPGLGGECSTDWFQDQFKGKKIFAGGHPQRIEVVKGQAPDGSDHAVDGISGATMTGNGITVFLNRDLEVYEKYFTKVRKG
jgi:Na+-transporting NADH:ubiquinone oxidoreductase subunit C